MRTVLAILAAVLVLPCAASEPGQPLGGDDFVFMVPGLSGTDYIVQGGLCAFGGGPDGIESRSHVCTWREGSSTDNQGNAFVVRPEFVPQGEFCAGRELRRLEIYRRDAIAALHLLAYLHERCGPNGIDSWDWLNTSEDGSDGYRFPNLKFNFDPTTGKLRFRLRTTNPGCDMRSTCFDKIIEFSGFTTLFDVLQTFTPQASTIGFRVPYMPEGMNGADYFDTYRGSLSAVGDWSQAQGLACGYPATAPSVGDYLEVADTLPDPVPGTGRYYITAARFQGQTRYGRQTSGGQLSGRDPAVLPACSVP